jgi:hypothetical protein
MPPAIALFRVPAKHPPLKLVFAFDFDVSHHYSQHPFVDINPRWVEKPWVADQGVLKSKELTS